MSNKNIKILSIVIGIVSLVYSTYSLITIIGLLSLGGGFDIRIISSNLIFTYLWLSPLATIGLFIAAIGLYKGKKWGHVLSNVCLFVFLGGFALVVIHHFNPEMLNTKVQLNSGWFVFYHIKLTLDTTAPAAVVAALLLWLNMKSVRRMYY